MSKTTPTPWKLEGPYIEGPANEWAIAETYTPGGDNAGTEDGNARLIVAAVNSYGAHCADPLAAAEADLLGQMREDLRVCTDYLDAYFYGLMEYGKVAPDVSIEVEEALKASSDLLVGHKPQEATDAD